VVYLKFADRTGSKAARIVIPSVRTTTPKNHARLGHDVMRQIIRLSWIPVGVGRVGKNHDFFEKIENIDLIDKID